MSSAVTADRWSAREARIRDAEAGAAPHFRPGLERMRPMLSATPKIIFSDLGTERTGWDPMGELQID